LWNAAARDRGHGNGNVTGHRTSQLVSAGENVNRFQRSRDTKPFFLQGLLHYIL
jgi:hypothetical protein